MWQVMISTHSPVFLDLTKDNTTIVRVERSTSDVIGSTTVFRRSDRDPSEGALKLDPVNKEQLKLLNICDPYFTEFFFGGQTLVVEGDTEYAAFKHILSLDPANPRYRTLHIVRARGKYTLCLVIKLLNRFKSNYSVLHDSDNELKRGNAFKANHHILTELDKFTCEKRPFLVASIPNFEMAMFEEEPDDDYSKPFFALHKMKDQNILNKVKALLDALISHDDSKLPSRCLSWSSMEMLRDHISQTSDVPAQQISMFSYGSGFDPVEPATP